MFQLRTMPVHTPRPVTQLGIMSYHPANTARISVGVGDAGVPCLLLFVAAAIVVHVHVHLLVLSKHYIALVVTRHGPHENTLQGKRHRTTYSTNVPTRETTRRIPSSFFIHLR